MASMDIDYVMNVLSKFSTDYFAKSENKSSKCVYLRQNSKNTRKGDKTEDQPAYFNEVPQFILALFKEHTKIMVELTDTKLSKVYEEMEEKDKTIADLKTELRVHRNEQDALASYNRRENLKIQEVEYQEGENTNEIVKEICKYTGREITDADISTSHRNSSTRPNNNLPPGLTTRDNKLPDIYVRFTIRVVKTEVFDKRKNLSTNSHCPEKYKNVAIYEDVTPLKIKNYVRTSPERR